MYIFVDIGAFWPNLMQSSFDHNLKTVKSDRVCLSTGGKCQVSGGKVLGGSSVINGLMYVRGNRYDFDLWESLGNPGWGYDDVLPYFKISENIGIQELRNSKYHGKHGYLDIEYTRNTSRLMQHFLEAGDEMNIRNPDYNGEIQFGMSKTQTTSRDGLRCSTNKAFLRPASHRKNLHISLNSLVTKIEVDSETKRAERVHFIREDLNVVIDARKEIILSAGAIRSPQLLLLSGIGPAKHLRKFGINVIKELLGVGKNLQNHVGFFPAFSITNPAADGPLSIIGNKILTEESVHEFIFKRNGLLYSNPAVESQIFINTKYQNASIDWPDIQILLAGSLDLLGILDKNGTDTDGYICFLFLLRPESRGQVYLQSNDPTVPPLVDGKYYDHPQDVEVVVGAYIFSSPSHEFNVFVL